jgi:hypothetical protein
MPRENATAPKVEEGVVTAIAAAPKGQRGLIKQLAKDWGISECVVEKIQARKKGDIQAMRAVIAERGLELTIGVQARLAEKLDDDTAMKETPLRDLALTHEKLVNSSVTAQDGHAPAVAVNFAFVKEGLRALSGYDERIKAVKAREVPAT